VNKERRTRDGRPTIAVFAKAPATGRVKTRLIPRLGPQGAAELHVRLVQHTLATLALARAGTVELWCVPDGDLTLFEACRRKLGVPLRIQPEGNLGQRMSGAAADVMSRANGVIIIGTDVPSMTPGDLTEARQALASGHDAVLGPAEDGGYYLIGLNAHAPELFEGVDWGCSAVLEETRARLRALGWHWHELSTRWDVDTPEDYDRLLADPRLALLAAEPGAVNFPP
jgi:rSAM/selenodomain-associated transferase 1